MVAGVRSLLLMQSSEFLIDTDVPESDGSDLRSGDTQSEVRFSLFCIYERVIIIVSEIILSLFVDSLLP